MREPNDFESRFGLGNNITFYRKKKKENLLPSPNPAPETVTRIFRTCTSLARNRNETNPKFKPSP